MAMGRHNVVLLVRFCDAFIRKGILKSFGVLVPALTVYLGTNYTTIGLILSLNAAFTQLACLLMNPLMKQLGTRRVAAVSGLVSGVCISCTALTSKVYLTGLLFVTAGFFSAASNLGTTTTLQQHYGTRFGAMNSLALIGISAGSTLLPLFTAELHRYYGLSGTLLILGGMLLNEFPIGAVLVPPSERNRHKCNDALNTETRKTAIDHVDEKHVAKESHLDKTGDDENDTDKTCNTEISCKIVRNSNVGPCVECEILSEASFVHEQESNNTSSCRDCTKVLKDTFDFRIFRDEKHFTFFMLPVLILSSLSNYGWVLFVTSYAISVGVEPFQAAYLAAVGAAGGMASCALQAIVFHKRPQWSPHLMATLCFTGAVTLIIQTLHSSLSYLLTCSFVVGASLYGVSTVVDAVVSVIVAPHNFQGAIAFTFALEGVGTLIAGPFSGFLFDFTGSFKTVFRVLGGMAALAHVLSVLLILTRRYNRKQYNAIAKSEDVL